MKAYENILITSFEDGTQLIEEGGKLSAIKSTNPIHTVTQGQSLLDISFIYYKDHSNWVNIYLMNDLFDPFTLVLGQQLLIPTN